MAKSIYTTAEAAVVLGVTPGRVRQMIVDKELRAEKFGRDLIISAESLATAKKRKTKPGPSSRAPAAIKTKRKGKV